MTSRSKVAASGTSHRRPCGPARNRTNQRRASFLPRSGSPGIRYVFSTRPRSGRHGPAAGVVVDRPANLAGRPSFRVIRSWAGRSTSRKIVGGNARRCHPQCDRIDPRREIRKRCHPIGSMEIVKRSSRSSGVWNNPVGRTRRERAQPEHLQPDGHRDQGWSGCVAMARQRHSDRHRCRVTRQIDLLNGD